MIFFPDFSIIIGRMKKVKAFFSIFVNSILPHEPYYSKILHFRFSKSLIYFLSILSLVYLAFLFKTVMHLRNTSLDAYKSCVARSFETIPANYYLYLSRGILSTSSDKPLFIWQSCFTKHPSLLAVIDERGHIDNFTLYQTNILLTGNDLGYGRKAIFLKRPLGMFPNPEVKYNKYDLLRWNSALFDTAKHFLPYALVFLLLITPLILVVGGVATVCLSSIFTVMFYGAFKKKYHFKKVVQLGFHAATLPVMLFSFTLLIYTFIPLTALLTTLLFLIFHLIAVYEAHYRS